jgi:hypothetical protein
VEGEVLGGTVVINTTITDAFPGIMEYNIDDTGWVDGDIPWDTTTVGDGYHTISIRTTDLVGHAVVQEVSVIVDNTPPDIEFVYPAEFMHINKLYPLKIYAYDEIELAKVYLIVDNETPIELFKAPAGTYYEYSLDTTLLADGEHVLEALAIDSVGQERRTNVTIFTDNTGPVIELSYTRAGTEKEAGEVTFYAEVTDPSGVRFVFLNIDNTGWREMIRSLNATTYVYVWPTTEQIGGVHIFQVKAVDELGNEAIRMGSITVEHKVKAPPPDYLALTLDLIPLIAFVFLVVLLAVFIFLFRRRIKGLMKEPPEGERIVRVLEVPREEAEVEKEKEEAFADLEELEELEEIPQPELEEEEEIAPAPPLEELEDEKERKGKGIYRPPSRRGEELEEYKIKWEDEQNRADETTADAKSKTPED